MDLEPSCRTVLDVTGLSICRGPHDVVSQLSLTVAVGEVVAITGDDDVAKSAILHCVAGLAPPAGGTITVAGSRLYDEDQPGGRRDTEFVTNNAALDGDGSLEQRAAAAAVARGMTGWQPRFEELLTAFRLSGRESDPIAHYSRGMRQKAALTLAFLTPVPLLLIDGPFSGLDEPGRDTVLNLLRDACNGGSGALVSTHDLGRDDALADRVLHLDSGRLVPLP